MPQGPKIEAPISPDVAAVQQQLGIYHSLGGVVGSGRACANIIPRTDKRNDKTLKFFNFKPPFCARSSFKRIYMTN